MKKKISKKEVKEKIQNFFMNIKDKTPKEVKKIKKLAMSKNIPLKELRKKFCKKCFTPYQKPKIKIKNKIKSVICENCEYINKWKIK
jgi:RNase P subunit RPR2